MPCKVLRHEVGVAALNPRVLQIPIDSFVQPHVNGTGPSNAVECDGHGIGRCRTCMVSLIASARFACQTMSGQAAVWGTSTSHGTPSHTTTTPPSNSPQRLLFLSRDLEIETALAVSHNDEHLIYRWTCIPWNQILGTDMDLT